MIAHVGKGEQVMVCGDAPFLGGGEPERALPLYTTPADYPLWFSQVGRMWMMEVGSFDEHCCLLLFAACSSLVF